MLKSWLRVLGLGAAPSDAAELTFSKTSTCPECGTSLARSAQAAPPAGADWFCPNLDCPAQVRRRIVHWCSPAVMDLRGADAAFVAQLVAIGLARDVAELYRLRPAEVAALEGRDAQFVAQFFDALAASRQREAWRLLFGLDIPEVTAAVAQQLTERLGAVDDILPAGPERLLTTGVGASVARNIPRWYGDHTNRKLVRRLKKAGLNFGP